MACTLAACHTSRHEYWSFPLSRATYKATTFEKTQANFSHASAGGEGQSVALAVLICLPFVLDLVILPVTGARDAYVAVTN